MKRLLSLASSFLILPVLAGSMLLAGCSQSVSSSNPDKNYLYKTPVLDVRATQLDFAYPTKRPSLKRGKEVFAQNCAVCHGANGGNFSSPKAQKDFLYATPIDHYIFLSTGEAPKLNYETGTRKQLQVASKHPAFRDKLSRDDRWAAIFYARHLAGGSDIRHIAVNDAITIKAVFGANCAVCHGNEGNANGFLVGHSSSHELKSAPVHGGVFYPAPARFTQFDRVYNRTDAQWYKFLVEGIYPSGMPAWLGNVDVTNKYTFNSDLLWMLVKYVRSLAYNNDLPEDEVKPAGLMPPTSMMPLVNPMIPPVPATDASRYVGEHGRSYNDSITVTTKMPLIPGLQSELKPGTVNPNFRMAAPTTNRAVDVRDVKASH